MRNGEYGLGIDIGDGTVAVAVCGAGDGGGAEALPLGYPGCRVMARVGAPVPVYDGDAPVTAEDLAAAAVQRARGVAADRAGRPDSWTVVTVPPSWSGHRRAVLARALESAGVPRFSLVSGAVAAVHHHVTTGDLTAEPTVAVYDLGASSLDTAVVGPTPEEPLGPLAVPPAPLPWGGRDVDDLVLGLVRPYADLPAGEPEARDAARALRAACVAAKEALAAETAVDVDGGSGPVRVTREELDELLAGPALASVAALAATVAAAGVDPERLDAVVLAGGGGRLPLIAELLSGELGRPVVVGPDPALSAALGAAELAAEAIAAEAAELPAPDAAGTALVAVDDALPAPRGRRRPRNSASPASRPAPVRPVAPGRSARVRRGVVVTGAFLGIVLLPPTAAGVLGIGGTAVPVGQEQGETEGQEVLAAGSPATADAPAPAPAAAPAPRTPTGGSGAGGSWTPAADPGTVRSSAGLAGRVTPVATRATTGRSAPAPAGSLPGTRATAGGRAAAPVAGTGTPSPRTTPPAQTPSESPAPLPVPTPTPTPADPPPATETPAAETPADDPPPTETPPSDPPAEQPPVDAPPVEPTPEPTPPAEVPVSEDA